MNHKSHLFRRAVAIILALAMIWTVLPQSVFAMDSSEIDSAIPLTLDEPVDFHSEDGKLLLSFTPEETRNYLFYMTDTDNCEPYAEVYDADLTLLASENLYSDTITCEFSAGATYYFEVTNLLDTAEFSASVCLTMPPRITFHANGGYFTTWEWDDETDQKVEIHTDSVSETYLKDDILYSWNTPTPENEDPAKAFAGFATTENAEVADVVFEETRAGDLTDLWAVWTEEIPVTYHINHDEIRIRGDEDIPVTEITEYHPAGSSFHIGGLPYDYIKPEGSLWHMDGVSTDPEATYGDYTDITLTEPLDLYCVWYEGVELYFDANGGSFGDQQTTANSVFRLGTTAYDLTHHWSELTPPDAGMALAGWSWTADGSDLAANDLEITRDLNGKTLYAVWSNGIPVTFHINSDQAWFNTDGNPADTITRFYAPGAVLHSYDSPFSFDIEEDSFLCYDGLSPDPNASENSYWEIAVTEPIDLYCIWFLGVEINYNANGGYFWGDPANTTYLLTYRIGESVDLMDFWNNGNLSHSDPDKALLGFSWFPDGRNSFTEFTPDEDMLDQTLYAVWGDGITVTYHSLNENVWFLDANGNKTDTAQVSYSPGTVLDIYNLRTRYNYDGSLTRWFFDRYYWDAEGTDLVTEEITVTEPIDLYCSWYEGVGIIMNANGGLFWGRQESVEYIYRIGDTTNFNRSTYPITPPSEDLVLSGWSWKADGSDPITTLPITKDLDGKTLYAIWDTGIQVTLHTNLEGAYFRDDSGNQVSDLTLKLKKGTLLSDILYMSTAVAPDESKFSDSYSRSLTPGGNPLPSDTVLTDGMDLYVIWMTYIPVTFDAGDGTYGGQQTYQFKISSNSYFSPEWYTAKPGQEGMAFLGWSLTNSKDDIIHGSLYVSDYKDGLTLHAIYVPGHSLTIKTNNPDYGKLGVFENGASYDYDNIPAETTFLMAEGKALKYLSVDIMPSDGYVFLGWSKTIDGEILDEDYIPDQDSVLYGIFAEGYSVFLSANGGTFDETLQSTVGFKVVNVLKGSAIGEIPVWHPEKTLAGWNTRPDGSGETIDLATYIPTGFLELYAIWTDAGSDIPVTGVSFAEKSVTILIEGTKSCPATVAPANATNKKVTYKSSNESVVTVDANGKLTGKLVGKATITATTADGGKKATLNVQVLFKDVADSAKYWFKPVYWAAEKGITNGYQSASYKGTAKFGTFGSEENCTREQMITFLYREAGSPAVSNADITKYNTFSDVKSSAKPYYLKAVVWAAKNGITKGYSSGPNKGKFGVGLEVSREDTVTFIYRMAKIYQKGFEDVKSEDLTNKDYKFSDVASGKYYQKPIVWAAKNGITKGYSSGPNKGKFGVGFDVLRKDIVTFLYRYDNL